MISVIIPTKNEERYIKKCLVSLGKQRKYIKEIIVVDGGSTDRTVEIARKYADIVLVDPKLDSPGKGRNAGAKIAKGSILAFVDADTLVCDKWGEAIINAFSQKEVLMASGPVYPYDSSIWLKIAYIFAYDFLVRVTRLLKITHFLGLNVAYRKDFFIKMGGFPNTKLSEDILLSMKIGRCGKSIFSRKMSVLSSARRLMKQGIGWILLYLIFNELKVILLGRPFEYYPEVR
ncbi:MAG: glycosyltransferase [Candidatus Methanodesulfokora sp.]|jgi:glycosyltransferase involved in cell wall biosynthesis